MDILVTYDIDTTTAAGVRLLAQVAKVCEGYGTRVQDSVFECRLSATRLERLIAALHEIIRPGTDSVNIYRFDRQLRSARISLARMPERDVGEPWIL
ncbi:MAG: CRISPR-associated endonuclease Cas2 [Actinomycetota bacterium]